MTDQIQNLKKLIHQSKKIVFFGGAGVSTESGVPDFRGSNGLYSRSPEELLSYSFFIKNPEQFYEFYKKNLIIKDIQPNITHNTLSLWEKEGKLLSIVTQNIDGLHHLAGNTKIWELHGSIHRNYCIKCGEFYSLEYIAQSIGVPYCRCGGIVKPDVVLYEEGLDNQVLQGAIRDLSITDLCIVAGTSLKVYPAAGLLRYISSPDKIVVINKGETSLNVGAKMVFDISLGKIFKEL